MNRDNQEHHLHITTYLKTTFKVSSDATFFAGCDVEVKKRKVTACGPTPDILQDVQYRPSFLHSTSFTTVINSMSSETQV